MMGETAANLERFLGGIAENRTDGAFSLVTPDLRTIGQVCNGATTKHQLRNLEGYAPSTFDRLVDKGLLLRGADHDLWISDSAAHVLLGITQGFQTLDEALEGASRPSRWPFQTRETDPFNGTESLLGPPLLYVLGKDLEDYGWGRQRTDRFHEFLGDVGLQTDGRETASLDRAREALVAGFQSIATQLGEEAVDANGGTRTPPRARCAGPSAGSAGTVVLPRGRGRDPDPLASSPAADRSGGDPVRGLTGAGVRHPDRQLRARHRTPDLVDGR